MPKSRLSKLAADLRKQGFDKSHVDTDDSGFKSAAVRCSQCQAVVVNGIAIHERSCPNEKRQKRKGKQMVGDCTGLESQRA